VRLSPTPLPEKYSEAAAQLYMMLANRMTGRTWYPQAWDMDKVVQTLQSLVISTGPGKLADHGNQR